jgi:hypothetical protein
MVEGKIPMVERRQVTNKLRTFHARVSKRDKARILDEVMSTTGMGRSTALPGRSISGSYNQSTSMIKAQARGRVPRRRIQ